MAQAQAAVRRKPTTPLREWEEAEAAGQLSFDFMRIEKLRIG